MSTSVHLLALLGDLLRTALAANCWTTDFIIATEMLLGAVGHKQN